MAQIERDEDWPSDENCHEIPESNLETARMGKGAVDCVSRIRKSILSAQTI